MKYLITGGAGFIGSNLACKLASKGEGVVVLDDLSRKGSEKNLEWLQESDFADRIKFVRADITKDQEILDREINEVECVYHMAAQVAVTTSVEDPRTDFNINALGTFNVLEAVRAAENPPFLLYSSTNKVYGGMEDVVVEEKENRYTYRDFPNGISEARSLDFHSPYGCSKGSADQYVRDYARIYGVDTVVFRQSCIYGPRQFGVEDQGWVAWFIIAAVLGKPIRIYGDGKQVRDVLFIDDLIEAFLLAFKNRKKVSGQVYNIGGGPEFVLSVWEEFRPLLEKELGKEIEVSYGDWRSGDQKIYVSDISKARECFSWQPHTPPQEGISILSAWVKKNKALFEDF